MLDIKELPYASSEPYPSINGIEGTQNDIKLLAKAFASCGSETTAILQYIFQHYTINDEDIAGVLLRIAKTEMHHHEILGELIVELKGTPYYTNGFGGDFSTKCVYESTNLRDMLVQDIEDEKSAIAYYEAIKPKLSNNNLREVIDRIVLDEQIHIDTFTKLLEYISYYQDNK